MEINSESQPRDRIGRRLIIFPLPLQGHINPILQLANILYSRGFSITILHIKLNAPNPSNYPHFSFYPIDDGLSESDSASNTDLLSYLATLNTKCAEPFKEALAQLLTDTSGDPIACVISDAVLYFTTAVCNSLKLPRLALRTGAVCSFLAFAAFPLLIQKGYLPVQGLFLRILGFAVIPKFKKIIIISNFVLDLINCYISLSLFIDLMFSEIVFGLKDLNCRFELFKLFGSVQNLSPYYSSDF